MNYKLLEQFIRSFYNKRNNIQINSNVEANVNVTTEGFYTTISLNGIEGVLIEKEVFQNFFLKLIQQGKVINSNPENYKTDAIVFNMLKNLPFIEEVKTNEIQVRYYSTSDLPGHFNNSMKFLNEQIVNNRKLLLKSPFFSLVFKLLKYMGTLSVQAKKEILLEIMYLTVKSSTTNTPITNSVAARRLGDTLTWLQEFNLIDKELNIIQDSSKNITKAQRNFWWVNQGQSAKQQTEGGFLWSPKTDRTGTPLSHHNNVMKTVPGDIVFAYSSTAIRSICIVDKESEDKPKPSTFSEHDNWGELGNYLKVSFYELDTPILKSEIPKDWRVEEDGPFDRNGNVKQGYFYNLTSKFSDKVLNMFKNRLPKEILAHLDIDGTKNADNEVNRMTDSEIINYIHQYINGNGFYYTKDQLKNFYLSLKTKPFVILSGISGTGKTKIVQLFAESIGATRENGQFALIPVRPDWSDGSDLIGYRDIKGEFVQGPLTKVLIEANKPENHNKPYFILLDEMNLARVEYYFSDLLSVMESREKKNDEYISAPVVDEEEIGKLYLRDNVYIVGTVNMDETTHPFSPKVLDRANTIEYNEVTLDNFGFLANNEEADSLTIQNRQLAGPFLTLKDAFSENEQLIREVTEMLVRINYILEENKSHFGYRVRDEICFYMIYNEHGNLMDRDKAFDYQIHQKILPRLTGNDVKTEEVLRELYQICTNHEWNESNEDLSAATLPMSAKKISNMIRKIVYDGFTSFWGS